MKIEKWQVENGIAKPVNPHCPDITFSTSIVVKSKLYAQFEESIKELSFATDAPDGIHSAEMFGEVEYQYKKSTGIWRKNKPRFQTFDEFYKYWHTGEIQAETRSFLPFKQLVNKPIQIVTVGTGIVQPINPNTNAIKIIEQHREELQAKMIKSKTTAYFNQLEIRISTLNRILKLIQS